MAIVRPYLLLKSVCFIDIEQSILKNDWFLAIFTEF